MIKKRHLFICSFNGRTDNLGDVLITSLLVKELSRYGFVYSLKRGGISSLIKRRTAVLLIYGLFARMFKGKIYFVDSPGARFRTLVAWENPSFRTKIVQALWKLLGSRRIAVGISVTSKIPLDVFRNHYWIGVRDRISIEAFDRAGIPATYCPDLGFLLGCRRIQNSSNVVLFSFRARIPENNHADNYESVLLSHVPAFVRSLSEQGWDCKFYYQVEEDKAFNIKLMRLASIPPEEIICWDQHASVNGSFGFPDAAVVVSNRLHVLVIAAAHSVLPIALTSRVHEKLVSLFNQIGWGEQLILLEGTEEPIQTLSSMVKNSRVIRESVCRSVFDHATSIRTQFSSLFSVESSAD